MRSSKILVFVTSMFLCVGGIPDSAEAQKKIIPTYPRIVKVLGLIVGQSTMAQLERRLGPGQVITGSHPQGARLWRSKQTGWLIYADGFEIGKDGTYLLNQLTLRANFSNEQKQDIPRINLTAGQSQILLGVTLNASKLEVLQAMQKAKLHISQTRNGSINVHWSVLSNQPKLSLEIWNAKFDFSDQKLNAITLYR